MTLNIQRILLSYWNLKVCSKTSLVLKYSENCTKVEWNSVVFYLLVKNRIPLLLTKIHIVSLGPMVISMFNFLETAKLCSKESTMSYFLQWYMCQIVQDSWSQQTTVSGSWLSECVCVCVCFVHVHTCTCSYMPFLIHYLPPPLLSFSLIFVYMYECTNMILLPFHLNSFSYWWVMMSWVFFHIFHCHVAINFSSDL